MSLSDSPHDAEPHDTSQSSPPPGPATRGDEGPAEADASEQESSTQAAREGEAHPTSRLPFPVVGIGASAGGLQAIKLLLEHLSADPGMAFVVVPHLAPDHKSEMSQLLQHTTEMPVAEAEDGMSVEPNHIYVIPPGKNISIVGSILHLSELGPREQRAPIDFFFRSLAESQGANAVGIVLSGTGSGGTLGLGSIKEAAGLTMVQDPNEAEHPGMPQSAIREGVADLALPARELAERLAQHRGGLVKATHPSQKEALGDADEEALRRIFAHLKARTGRNFSHYKRSTMLRRIGRRMQVAQAESLADYLAFLREREAEAQALFRDLLITVTHFFRDEEAFEALREQMVAHLFEGRDPGDSVRVWVAGCATGESSPAISRFLLPI